jgi:hypothetical protein
MWSSSRTPTSQVVTAPTAATTPATHSATPVAVKIPAAVANAASTADLTPRYGTWLAAT